MGPKFINSENLGRNFSNNQAKDDEIGKSDWAHAHSVVCCPRVGSKASLNPKTKRENKDSNITLVLKK